MSEFTPPADDIDPGEPLPELAALAEAPSAGFLYRVRDGILRRVGGVHFLDFAVTGFLGFLQEIAELFFGMLGRNEPRGGDPRE